MHKISVILLTFAFALAANANGKQFSEHDPHGYYMAIMCMSVVFGCLLLLFIAFQTFTWAMRRYEHRHKHQDTPVTTPTAAQKTVVTPTAAGKATSETLPVVIGMALHEHQTAVATVIGMALHEYLGSQHDEESGVITITQHSAAWADLRDTMRQVSQL